MSELIFARIYTEADADKVAAHIADTFGRCLDRSIGETYDGHNVALVDIPPTPGAFHLVRWLDEKGGQSAKCPHKSGTVEADAWWSGETEGQSIWTELHHADPIAKWRNKSQFQLVAP